MIGIVIITHGNVGISLLETGQTIAPGLEGIVVVSIEQKNDIELSRNKVIDAIKKVDSGNGVLVFTDVFGGTPSNIAISLLGDFNIEVISGVNLPMILKLPFIRDKNNIKIVANTLKEHAKKSISVASEILNKTNDR